MEIILRLHWYDKTSKEGVFKDAQGRQYLGNFELCQASHELASKGMRGQYYSVKAVSGIINEILEITNNEGAN